jgi:hypothetical protein
MVASVMNGNMCTVVKDVQCAVEAENWQAIEGDIPRSCQRQDGRNAWAIMT